jgi:NifU-like protein
MNFYPERVNELFLSPLNVGEVERASAAGTVGSFTCGSILRLTVRFDSNTHTIKEAKFKASGCGYSIAAASLLCEAVVGMNLIDAGAFCSRANLTENFFIEELREVPDERVHCLSLCRDALKAALNNYRSARLEEWHGEEALICTCFGVSEKVIEEAIETENLQTVDEVTRNCNAGGGCGSCQPLIEEILDDYWRMKS